MKTQYSLALGNRKSSLALTLVLLQITSLMLATSPVMANPIGGTVIAGGATISHHGHTVTINTTDRAVINWQGFSIGAGETTRFVQPSVNSAVLNRVTGADPSMILGQLQSNGQVFLINPNGIVFGQGSRVDVGGLVASTLDIRTADFMQGGDLHFSGTSRAGIINRGNIRAIEGDIYMIANHVENHGTITATNGNVGLAAGQDVMLIDSAHERLVVRPSASSLTSAGITSGITNTGTIDAIRIELAAHGNVYALAINNRGTLRASGSVTRGGRVYLTAKGGTINNQGDLIAKSGADGGKVSINTGQGGRTIVSGKIDVSGSRISGSQGGRVELLGDYVSLASADIDASGIAGGGVVLVGGDLQGGGSADNALLTEVSSDTTISANATGNGDGGTIIIWSDDATDFSGSISARGGANGGDGGFIEVSGKNTLTYNGTVDALAANGASGDILFDPGTVNIGGPAFTPLGNRTFTAAQVRTAWLAGNLTITTTDNGNGSGPADINVLAELFPASPGNTNTPVASSNSLTFDAGRNLRIGAEISNKGSGNFNFTAGRDIQLFANLTAGDLFSFFGGNINLTAGRDVVLDTSQLNGQVRLSSVFGNINVDSRDVDLLGSSFDSAVLSTRFGIIDVDASRDVLLSSGTGTAQIGYDRGDPSTGFILVDAGRDIILRAGGQEGRAQIGAGAIESEGRPINFIEISAGRNIRIAARGKYSTAMIGNGSPFSSGFTASEILVSAGNDLVIAARGRQSTAQIGHGGRESSWFIDPALNKIDVRANRLALRATGRGSHAQIGNGGTNAEGTASGPIDVLVRSDMAILASGRRSLSQVGHGGRGFYGMTSGDIQVTVGKNLALAAGHRAQSRIGHLIDPGEEMDEEFIPQFSQGIGDDFEGNLPYLRLMPQGDIVVAIDQLDPLSDGGGRLYMTRRTAIDAGGAPNEVRIFGTRRLGNQIANGANFNGIRFRDSLPPGTLAGGKWNENTEFVNWDHEQWGYSFLDASDPSLPYNGPFGFYYLDSDTPPPPMIPQFPHDQFDRYALWAETLELMYWSGPYGMYYDSTNDEPGKSITGSSSAELYGEDDE